MFKTSFAAKAALACVLMMPVAGAAQSIDSSSPAVAVSMGATFGNGATFNGATFGNEAALDLGEQAGLQSLAVAAATGARSAVANSTASNGNNNTNYCCSSYPYANGSGGATANSGASATDARVSSTVKPSQNNYYNPNLPYGSNGSNGFESEVLIQNQYID